MRDGLILGDAVVAWVAERLGVQGDTAQARGIGWAKDGRIVIGLMFYGYTRSHIFVHVARDKWVRFPPTLVAAMMDYPFVKLGCAYLRALISEHNGAAIAFARKLGASLEAELQDGTPSGNMLVFGLPRSGASRWLTASYSKRLSSGGDDGRRRR